MNNGLSQSKADSLEVTSVMDSMRSSNSSLAKSEGSDAPMSSALRGNRGHSSSTKKVSINEPTVTLREVIKRDSAISPQGERMGSHRASIIQVSADKKAKKVKSG